MTDEINLNYLNMNHFTVLDAEGYCKIFNINTDDIKKLLLNNNKLENISGVNIFKNLRNLGLNNNQITDLSILKNFINLTYLGLNNNPIKNLNNLKNLVNLELLAIDGLDLTDELKTVNILKTLPKLKYLDCKDTFKTIDIKLELKGIRIYD